MAGLTLGSLQGFYFRFNNSPFSSVADSEMITCQLSRTALSHNLSVPTFSINLPFFSIFSILDFGYFSRRLFRRVTQAVGWQLPLVVAVAVLSCLQACMKSTLMKDE